jgi:predicted Fe-Mo cluster-binding NifX family protein
MKLAISSQGPDLDATIDPRFGRCAHLLLVETDDGACEAVANPYANESGGVGTRLAGLAAQRGVQVVLTGSVGTNAQQALEAAGIRIVAGCAGTVRAAVEQYQADGAVASGAGGVHAETSTVGRRGGGRGQGMGRGRGMGPCGGGGQRRHRHGRSDRAG